VTVILQASAVSSLPAFFTEYYTTADGTVDNGMRGKLETAGTCSLMLLKQL